MAQNMNSPQSMASQIAANSPTSIASAIQTPIAESVIQRVVRGVKYVVSGAAPEGWFTPWQPLPPFAPNQGVEGRQFDYQVGYNLQQQPKSQEGVTFGQLRGLADSLDMLRLVIETRKDLLCKLQWEIKPIDPDLPQDDRCKEVMEFLQFPDNEHSWEDWLRMVLEDLFVLDAPTIYPRYTLGGKIYAFEPVDGSTIKRVIDGSGRTPVPPEVAYQQVLKGVPAVDYSRDELIYKPRNLRTNKVYGYSPVEQILMTVNIALRRQMSQLQYYSEGSTPDMILTVPPEWNPDQVKQFYDWWQSMLSGNTGNRRKTMFVPNGVGSINTKEGLLKDEYDEWLAKIICYAFSLSPQQFMKQMNRATAGTAAESSKEEGLEPIMQWIKNLINYMIWKYFGYKDLQLSWVSNKDPDLMQQAQINQIYVNTGIKTANEVREELGLDALEEPVEPTTPNPTEPNPNGKETPVKAVDENGEAAKFEKLSPIAKRIAKKKYFIEQLLTKGDDHPRDEHGRWISTGNSKEESNQQGKGAASYLAKSLNEKDVESLPKDVQQNFRDIYTNAADQKDAFDKAIAGVAKEQGATSEPTDLKGSGRAAEKLMQDYKGDTSQLKDILRTTVVANSVEDANKTLGALKEKFGDPIKERNLLDSAKESLGGSGYRDINAVFDFNGVKAEVQINLKAMVDAKHEGHDDYKVVRAIEGSAKETGRNLTASESKIVAEKTASMKVLYEAAWATVKP